MCAVVLFCEDRRTVSAYSESELEGEYHEMGKHKEDNKPVLP